MKPKEDKGLVVAVVRINRQRIRATLPLDDKRQLYGYGPTIPAALSALARAIERWAMTQAEEILAGNIIAPGNGASCVDEPEAEET